MSRPTEATLPAPAAAAPAATRAEEELRRIGTRLRTARESLGQSRKALAAAAGVSERYLADIESGTGNTSIRLLIKVAAALGLSLQQAVGGVADGPPRGRRIALIGLRGAGKSTLGRLVAAELTLPFIELNQEIAAHSGLAPGEIFSIYGGEGYRRLEHIALREVLAREEAFVLAVGGGVVAAAETFEQLLAATHTVWLRARPQQHLERVRAQGDNRPMAGNRRAMDDLRTILEAREALYARAAATLDTSEQTVAQSAHALARTIAGLIDGEAATAPG